MFWQLFESVMTFTFRTSFLCFGISYGLGILIYILVMVLLVKPQKGLELDIDFIVGSSLLSWISLIILCLSSVFGGLVWLISGFVKLLDDTFNNK